ncbi:hypothetical protein KSP40_PGU015473 [Platanthera guangdongensis]|uniref:Uncharacterized protein n=1 Tax=Platanthera guangdongensis TaxID=2320717 RepID=A0ABR2N5J0_9ASPA
MSINSITGIPVTVPISQRGILPVVSVISPLIFQPRASWFSPKCVEAQQLTGHLGVKHCSVRVVKSCTKSRQTLNTRYDPKQESRSASEMMGDKLHRREGNNSDHQLTTSNDLSNWSRLSNL